MSRIGRLISFVLFVLFLLTNSFAAAETVHVDQMLESMFITLKLDADVESLAEGTSLTIYTTDYPTMDTQSWAKMFSADATNVHSDEKEISLEQNGMFAKYFPEEARLGVSYSEKDYFIGWDLAKIGRQAAGLMTTPEQAQETAQAWIDQLNVTLGWDGYVFSACYTMPSEAEWYEVIDASEFQKKDGDETTGCYVVEFVKMLGDYSVAYDQSPNFDDSTLSYTKGDHIQLIIDDNGIGCIEGYCRNYEIHETAPLQVTLNEAIDILRENMDYVECYPNGMPCEITEISMCYRLVQKLPVSDKNAAVQMEARPAWRFASKINRWDQQTFFLFVDAVTGEVLP